MILDYAKKHQHWDDAMRILAQRSYISQPTRLSRDIASGTLTLKDGERITDKDYPVPKYRS